MTKVMRLASVVVVAAVLGAGLVSPASASPRTDFVAAVKKAEPSLKTVTSASLIGYGTATCKGLKQGLTFDEVATSMAKNSDWTTNESGAVLAGAAMFLCPKYKKAFVRWINS